MPVILFLIAFLCVNNLSASEEAAGLSRIYAHLAINDPVSALDAAQSVLKDFPESRAAWQAFIRALARLDQDQALFETWKQYRKLFPDAKDEHRLHEVLAWAVIEKANRSTLPLMRVRAMLAAFFSQDAKGTAILAKNLGDRNLMMRSAAIEVASHLRDATLQDLVYTIFLQEKNWKIRLLATAAVGKMGITSARKDLITILSRPDTRDEEKAAALEALVNLTQKARKSEIEHLIRSERAALRALACKIVLHTQMNQAGDLIAPLLQDASAEVRAAALQTLGILKIQHAGSISIHEAALHLQNDHDSTVAVSAAWYLTLFDREEGLAAFQKLLRAPHEETRVLAAAGLAATGKHGSALMQTAFHNTQELYVGLNLALGMIGQRVRMLEAGSFLAENLQQDRQRWSWEEQGIFKVLKANQKGFEGSEETNPETVNQLVRLEMINLLAVIQHPSAFQCVKSFLMERSWGISGMAAALLLTEGDEEALDLVQCLLQDSDPRIRVQAACILAIWGRGEAVIELLQKAYPGADRTLKEHILEALCKVGSSRSISFFLDCLEDPSPALRVIAAAGLLLCLYH